MAEKVYLNCSAKKIEFQNGGSILKIGVKADELRAFAADHVNERGYVNLIVGERRSVGKYGETHSVYLDTYEPKGDRATHAPAPVIADEDLPF